MRISRHRAIAAATAAAIALSSLAITPATAHFYHAVKVAVCAACDQWWQHARAAYATQVGTLA